MRASASLPALRAPRPVLSGGRAVEKDSPAATAGLLAGDRLLAVAGVPVTEGSKLATLLPATATALELRIFRGATARARGVAAIEAPLPMVGSTAFAPINVQPSSVASVPTVLKAPAVADEPVTRALTSPLALPIRELTRVLPTTAAALSLAPTAASPASAVAALPTNTAADGADSDAFTVRVVTLERAEGQEFGLGIAVNDNGVACVSELDADSPAAAAAAAGLLKVGDQLDSINDIQVTSGVHYVDLLPVEALLLKLGISQDPLQPMPNLLCRRPHDSCAQPTSPPQATVIGVRSPTDLAQEVIELRRRVHELQSSSQEGPSSHREQLSNRASLLAERERTLEAEKRANVAQLRAAEAELRVREAALTARERVVSYDLKAGKATDVPPRAQQSVPQPLAEDVVSALLAATSTPAAPMADPGASLPCPPLRVPDTSSIAFRATKAALDPEAAATTAGGAAAVADTRLKKGGIQPENSTPPAFTAPPPIASAVVRKDQPQRRSPVFFRPQPPSPSASRPSLIARQM